MMIRRVIFLMMMIFCGDCADAVVAGRGEIPRIAHGEKNASAPAIQAQARRTRLDSRLGLAARSVIEAATGTTATPVAVVGTLVPVVAVGRGGRAHR